VADPDPWRNSFREAMAAPKTSKAKLDRIMASARVAVLLAP
jgi:hypothetical protein